MQTGSTPQDRDPHSPPGVPLGAQSPLAAADRRQDVRCEAPSTAGFQNGPAVAQAGASSSPPAPTALAGPLYFLGMATCVRVFRYHGRVFGCWPPCRATVGEARVRRESRWVRCPTRSPAPPSAPTPAPAVTFRCFDDLVVSQSMFCSEQETSLLFDMCLQLVKVWSFLVGPHVCCASCGVYILRMRVRARAHVYECVCGRACALVCGCASPSPRVLGPKDSPRRNMSPQSSRWVGSTTNPTAACPSTS